MTHDPDAYAWADPDTDALSELTGALLELLLARAPELGLSAAVAAAALDAVDFVLMAHLDLGCGCDGCLTDRLAAAEAAAGDHVLISQRELN